MALWVICGILVIVCITSWIICSTDRELKKFKTYLVGRFALFLLLFIFGASKSLNFFVYDQEIREVNVEKIARFNDGSKNRILAIVEIDGEDTAFEISRSYHLEVGEKLKISKKSSKFPDYDNWSEDWKIQK